MNTENMIDITGTDLREFVKMVYKLSSPQGLGMLHYTEGPLTDEEVDAILSMDDHLYRLYMDYVNGRSCKMTVYKVNDKLFINDSWFDHSDEQLNILLEICDS